MRKSEEKERKWNALSANERKLRGKKESNRKWSGRNEKRSGRNSTENKK